MYLYLVYLINVSDSGYIPQNKLKCAERPHNGTSMHVLYLHVPTLLCNRKLPSGSKYVIIRKRGRLLILQLIISNNAKIFRQQQSIRLKHAAGAEWFTQVPIVGISYIQFDRRENIDKIINFFPKKFSVRRRQLSLSQG